MEFCVFPHVPPFLLHPTDSLHLPPHYYPNYPPPPPPPYHVFIDEYCCYAPLGLCFFDYDSRHQFNRGKADHNKKILVRWIPPEPTWLKLNFDGGVSKGRAGCGNLLRKHGGAIVGAQCCKGVKLDVLDTELRALWQGLKLAVRICKPTDKLWVEGDSLLAINAVKLHYKSHPSDSEVTQEILQLLDYFAECRFSHIYREGNCAADWLAGIGKFVDKPMVFTPAYFPKELEFLAFRDLHETFERVPKLKR